MYEAEIIIHSLNYDCRPKKKRKEEEPKHIKAEDSTDFKVTCGKTGVAL